MEKTNITKLWAVEWNPTDRWFDVCPVWEMLANNNSTFSGGGRAACYCVGIFKTMEEVEEFLIKARAILKKLGIVELTV